MKHVRSDTQSEHKRLIDIRVGQMAAAVRCQGIKRRALHAGKRTRAGRVHGQLEAQSVLEKTEIKITADLRRLLLETSCEAPSATRSKRTARAKK